MSRLCLRSNTKRTYLSSAVRDNIGGQVIIDPPVIKKDPVFHTYLDDADTVGASLDWFLGSAHQLSFYQFYNDDEVETL